MPRLRNIRTGAVVSCSEATAARLGSEWRLADEPKPTQRRVAKKETTAPSDDS